jgi:tRNA pseudouridine55 synthase
LVSGFILLDKPSGPTSHDMVMTVRRGTGEKRVGHAGTLDPLATGLLILCLGAATRLSDYLRDKDKRYLARVRLGQTTNTYDADGEITATSVFDLPSRTEVEITLKKFRGPIEQRPPAFSAIKRGGKKAYELARAGEAVDLAPRPVEIYMLELLDWQPPDFTLDVTCSSGTYIRSLAHDLGQTLGCGAHLTGLRRIASGRFQIEEAVTLDELQKAFAAGREAWERYLRPADLAVADWPKVRLTAEAAARIQHGQPVPLENGEQESRYARAYNSAGEFIALLRADSQARVWRPYKVLIPPKADSNSPL